MNNVEYLVIRKRECPKCNGTGKNGGGMCIHVEGGVSCRGGSLEDRIPLIEALREAGILNTLEIAVNPRAD